MAINIYQKPELYTPAYNKQVLTAFSTDWDAFLDFKYKVEVIINTISNIEYVIPRPDGWMVIDIKEKVKNHIKRNFNPNDFDFTLIEDKAVDVHVIVSEYYSDTTHFYETHDYTAFDACLKEIEFNNYNYFTYIEPLIGEQSLNICDNEVMLNTDIYLHFFGDTVHEIVLKGNRGAYCTLTLNASYVAGDESKIFTVNVGQKLFNVTSNPPFDGLVVDVELRNNVSSPLQTYQYTFKNSCSNYLQNTIYYLTRSGRIMYKHFDMLSETTANRKVNSVKLNKDKLNTGTGMVTSNVYDRLNHNTSTQITYKRILNTNWLTELEKQNLEELFDSPCLWLYDGIEYLPISNEDLSYKFNKLVNEPLFNLTVNIEFDAMETRQRGI